MGLNEPPGIEQQSPWRIFAGDLSAAARTLAKTPALVTVTVGLHVAFGAYLLATDLERRSHTRCLDTHALSMCHPHPLLGLIGLIYFLVSIFLIGFYGTQRVWFLRAQRGQVMDRATVWRMSWSFLGRYFTVGLLVGIIWAPIGIAIGAWIGRHSGRHVPWGYSLALYLMIFVVDVLGTLVGPALAFSTRRVRVAVPLGVRMLFRTWPKSAWYAVAPPLTVFVIGIDLIRRSAGIVSAVIVSAAISPLLLLWTKSATVLFYLRQVPEVGPDGAAYFARDACRNGHPVDKHALYCPVCGVSVNEIVDPE